MSPWTRYRFIKNYTGLKRGHNNRHDERVILVLRLKILPNIPRIFVAVDIMSTTVVPSLFTSSAFARTGIKSVRWRPWWPVLRAIFFFLIANYARYSRVLLSKFLGTIHVRWFSIFFFFTAQSWKRDFETEFSARSFMQNVTFTRALL